MTANNAQFRNNSPNHYSYFYLTLVLWVIGCLFELGVFLLKISTPTEFRVADMSEIEDLIFTIALLSIPSVIHLWIFVCLLKKQTDTFCRFFDFTMFFSVLSFTLPQILFDLFQIVIKSKYAFIVLLIGAFVTVILIVNLVVMITLVYFELTGENKNIPVVEDEIKESFSGFFKNFFAWLTGILSRDWWKGGFNLEKWNQFFLINNLKSTISAYPFWRMLHFLAIFLSISYTFGLIFAYYDTFYRRFNQSAALSFENVKESLQKTNLNQVLQTDTVTDDQNPDFATELPKEQIKNAEFTSNRDKAQHFETKAQCFYFSKGSSLLQNLDEDDATSGNDYATRITELNNRAFREVLDTIRSKLTERSDDNSINFKSKILRIELNGYADEAKIIDKEIYSSNYELSWARSIAVQNEIYKGLQKGVKSIGKTPFQGWNQIEWMHYPHSNEKPKGSNCNIYTYPDLKQVFYFDSSNNLDTFARTVEIYIYEIKDLQTNIIWKTNEGLTQIQKKNDKILDNQEKISNAIITLGKANQISLNLSDGNYRQPQLLDYLYFAGGVVTTNAAGDIKPATPFARFLISIIGFFQIFFLVGFFSTLISVRGPTDEHR